jgi:hypothetical protein
MACREGIVLINPSRYSKYLSKLWQKRIKIFLILFCQQGPALYSTNCLTKTTTKEQENRQKMNNSDTLAYKIFDDCHIGVKIRIGI